MGVLPKCLYVCYSNNNRLHIIYEHYNPNVKTENDNEHFKVEKIQKCTIKIYI